jgi:hypothetical protein
MQYAGSFREGVETPQMQTAPDTMHAVRCTHAGKAAHLRGGNMVLPCCSMGFAVLDVTN